MFELTAEQRDIKQAAREFAEKEFKDVAAWHKRKSLNWHFFEPVYLPPYSPDFNPIERIWLIMKAEHFANIHCKNRTALIERADHTLCDFMDNPKKIASPATPIVTEL